MPESEPPVRDSHTESTPSAVPVSPRSIIPLGETIESWTATLRKSAGVIEEVYEVQTATGTEEHTLFWTQNGPSTRSAIPADTSKRAMNVVYYLHPTDTIKPRQNHPPYRADYGSALGPYRTFDMYDSQGLRGGLIKNGRLLLKRDRDSVFGPESEKMPPGIRARLVQQGLEALFWRKSVWPYERERSGLLLEALTHERGVTEERVDIPTLDKGLAPARTLQRWNHSVTQSPQNAQPNALQAPHPHSRPTTHPFLLQTTHLAGTDPHGPPTRIRLHCGGGEIRLEPSGDRFHAAVSPSLFPTDRDSLTKGNSAKHWSRGDTSGMLAASSGEEGDTIWQGPHTEAPPEARAALAEIAEQYKGFFGPTARPRPHSVLWYVDHPRTHATSKQGLPPGHLGFSNVPLVWEWRYRPPEHDQLVHNRALIESLEANAEKDNRKYGGKTGQLSVAFMSSPGGDPNGPADIVRFTYHGEMTYTRSGDENSRYSFNPYYARYDDTRVLFHDSLFPMREVASKGVILPTDPPSDGILTDALKDNGYQSLVERLDVHDHYCSQVHSYGPLEFIGGDFSLKESTITREIENSVTRSGVMLVGWWRYQRSNGTGIDGVAVRGSGDAETSDRASKKQKIVIDLTCD